MVLRALVGVGCWFWVLVLGVACWDFGANNLKLRNFFDGWQGDDETENNFIVALKYLRLCVRDRGRHRVQPRARPRAGGVARERGHALKRLMLIVSQEATRIGIFANFRRNKFLKTKNVAIFATAKTIAAYLRRNGRVVDCGSLENC